MTDPHVTTLEYRLVPAGNVEYRNPPEVNVRWEKFDGELAADRLVLEPKVHFGSEEEARAAARPHLRAWEISAGLQVGRPRLRFVYESATLIDRAPDPETRKMVMTDSITISEEMSFRDTCLRYPEPPKSFDVTPEVEVLWERYCGFLEGKEPLLSMAYFCLTLLERGDRRAAAKKFRVSYEVLDKLGELTSTRGDRVHARKVGKTPSVPLSAREERWVRSAIPAIVEHLAQGGDREELQMASLPNLGEA